MPIFIDMNEMILEMIHVSRADGVDRNDVDASWNSTFNKFIHYDGKTLPPIPIFTQVNPFNTHQFYVHIILSLSKYVTELDVLQNGMLRACFRKAHLVGPEVDDDSLRTYVNDSCAGTFSNR